MFTGLVADLGTVTAVDATADGVRLAVRTSLAGELSEGDSRRRQRRLPDRDERSPTARSAPTSCTSRCGARRWREVGAGSHGEPGAAAAGGRPARRPLRAGPRRRRRRRCARRARTASRGSSRSTRPPELLRYVVEKGSIAVDGVSLTVSAIDDESFSVSLIPETLERTTLGTAEPGRPVNLEVDVLAKYVEKLVR